MNVFVTGATGFVGQEVIRQLHEAGHQARILARRPDSRAVKEVAARPGVSIHAGDVTARDSLNDALGGMDAVIHLVGIISEVGNTTFENVHTHGTRNIVAVAQRSGVRRFVQMSALGTRPNAVSRYHRTKWAAEESVRASGLEFTIFRPSLIYGPRDHFVNLFAKIIRLSPVVPVIGGGTARFQPISVESVARAFVGALTERKSIGQTCDLCGAEMLTLPDIVDQVLAVMNRRRIKWRAPSALVRFQAAALEFVYPRVLRKAPPLNRDQLIMLQEDNVGNAQPADSMFGLTHESFAEGIRYVRREA